MRGEWGAKPWPLVPGHEIIGIVTRVGAAVRDLAVGARVGVGPQHASCGACGQCTAQSQVYCERGFVETYGARLPSGHVTQGGYALYHRTDARFAVPIPDALPSARAAPLLCAGITVYSPMRRLRVGGGSRVGVLGLGGLGHCALQLARAMGAEVTALTSSADKAEDAKRLGAGRVVSMRDPEAVRAARHSLDVLVHTSSAQLDWDEVLKLLAARGTLVLLGLHPDAIKVSPFALVMRGLSIMGSLVGSPSEVAEMLQLCARQGVLCDVRVWPLAEAESALQAVEANTVRYRAVLEMPGEEEAAKL